MPVFDYDIFDMLDEVRKHYRSNMSNTFIRSALLSMDMPYDQRNSIENITEKLEMYKNQGYKFEELYNGVYSISVFIYKARTEVIPGLKGSSLLKEASSSEKVLADMAADNLKANLNILADRVNELYLKVVRLDVKSHKVKSPVYTRMEELDKLGQLLTSLAPGVV
ncbi:MULTISPECIES: hypothetical protein [unclassified Oceanispirochaeta]|uniref:hypothetical protein n=1 Tax=unclassified Oceanispirochaeta TaxID=2635722 RepID=UPI000E08D7F0|nr:MULTISPECIES: hypothetical protein [unclassified Oceanispirochaeta]MBF9015447.1 hypothetical protein [Oceanispirochaeta sp. M2]NPD71906.1 hypothetical protein [Oceanispirochaeta sp. M1]RDG32714.1 hypothetical protein DV872_07325 [Oceanispirochaeta sp. M1]